MRNQVNHIRYTWVNKVTTLEIEKGERPRLTNHFPRPENAAIQEEVRDIVRLLPLSYQQLYKAYTHGYDTREIAMMYRRSKWTINNRKKKMVKVLGDAWRVPPKAREQIIRNIKYGW